MEAPSEYLKVPRCAPLRHEDVIFFARDLAQPIAGDTTPENRTRAALASSA